jgi:cellulose synthase operon protein C
VIDQPRADRLEELAAARASGRPAQMEVHADGQLAHFNLGLAFRQKGYYNEALREYAKALERAEEPMLVRQAMAEVHLLRHEPHQAVELYDELLTHTRDSAKLWNERGVALHQDGRFADAAESYQCAVQAEPGYALAHNNLGVARYHQADVEGAFEAFRVALELQPAFTKARLNLALLLSKHRRYQLALEAYRAVLETSADDPAAWNGIGLVLADLHKHEDARNAFARAVQARPDYAEAHYNLSFALSNLGDFEGALRETKRALELDPYYVAQKFELAIDLEYEDPDLSIQPELGAAERLDEAVEDFAFDPSVLDSLFTSLTPSPSEAAAEADGAANAFSMAADYLGMGLYDRAAAEVSRALARGASRPAGFLLLGDIYSRQGLHGEALERYREAGREAPDDPRAQMGEARALLATGRGREALMLAEAMLVAAPPSVETLMLAASARSDSGDPAAALAALDQARKLAPQRADVHQKMGDIARSLGDNDGAMAAYRHALELDGDFAVVRRQLAQLLRERGLLHEAERELTAALDAVPTYVEATLALASIQTETGRAPQAMEQLIGLLERDPYNLDALLALGETLIAMGQKGDAVQAFRRILRFDPDHVGALYYDGVLLNEQKHFREAIERWTRVIERDPAGEFARRARRASRTASDLQSIFARQGAA